VSAADFEGSLRAIADGDRAAAPDRWDPAYVAGWLGNDPIALLEWVRSQTRWVPYRGVLRGPVGVLLDRQGNSLDRALLLATLLRHAGYEIRLARAELPAERARELLPSLLASRSALVRGSETGVEGDWRPDVRLITGTYLKDSAAIARKVEARLDRSIRLLDTLDARTDTQAARLRALLPKPAAGSAGAAEQDDPIEALRDHWWVQRRDGERWIDLDLLAVPDDPAPAATADPAALDSALYQRVVVRLVTERLSNGSLSERKVLEREVRPSELIGKPVVLEVTPLGLQPGLISVSKDPAAALRMLALEENEWHATLLVGGEVAEAVVSPGPVTGAAPGNPLGGLGLGIGRAVGSGGAELSAAWIEYETRVPGRPSQVVRRQLFDLVGPAARAARRPIELELTEERRLERSLALTRTTEIVPLASAVAPEYLIHLAASAALANQNFLRAAPAAAATPLEDLETFAKSVQPGPSHLYTLAVTRMSADPDAPVYLDRPNVLSRHAFLGLRGGRIVRLEGTDIVVNDVAVAPGSPDPAEIRRRQGIRDTNAEAILYDGQPVVGSVADGFARSDRWIAVTSADDALLAGLPADTRRRMADDLAAGYVLIAPASLADASRPELAGWWRIDPRTGQTLGVSGTGWGQTLAERALKYSVILATVVVEAWMFEFLICGGALGQPAGGGPVARAPSPMDWFATPAWADEPTKDPCVWEAWKAALTAGLFYKASVAWGILATRIKLWRMLKAVEAAEGAAGASAGGGGTGSGAPGGGTPSNRPPPQECQSGGGTPRPAGEEPGLGTPKAGEEPGAAPPPAEPSEPIGPPKPPEEPPAGTPREEPAPPKEPAEKPAPFDEAWGDASAEAPGTYSDRSKGWAEKAPDAERQLGEAEAYAREMAAKAEQARKDLAAAEANPPAPDDYDALQRLNDARMDITQANGARSTADRARAALNRIRALVEQYRRLESLNEALIQARAQMREASDRLAELIRSGKADFQGPENAEWKAIFDRYNQALREYTQAVREVGKVTAQSGRTLPVGGPGGTLPLPSGPASPGGQSCSGASPPPGSPPPGMSPPPGSPPPSPALDAQRRLQDAERALEGARAERDLAMRKMDEANEKMFADEAAAQARGEGTPPQTSEFRALLRRKIDAIKRFWRAEEEYNLARFQAQMLEQQAAGSGASGAAPIVGGDPAQVLVGLGGMAGP
jgi:hypothetical protein